MNRIIKGAIIAATSLVAVGAGTAAHASVTINADGTGFIGKGNVQTALGYNNSALQTAVDAKPSCSPAAADVAVAGAGRHPVRLADRHPAGVQSGTQSGTQAGTQVVSQDLTCTFTNGSGTKTFHRDGVRDGARTGTREGVREGAREGIRDGGAPAPAPAPRAASNRHLHLQPRRRGPQGQPVHRASS